MTVLANIIMSGTHLIIDNLTEFKTSIVLSEDSKHLYPKGRITKRGKIKLKVKMF